MNYSWETFGLRIPEILVPAEGTDYNKWAVNACDQYTSEPEYWDDVEYYVGDAPSALHLMLPEVYLNDPQEPPRIRHILRTMSRYLRDGTLRRLPAGCMLVRRTSEGRSRLGLVIATDLERYDYRKGVHGLIRATEETVVERIPPRLLIRDGAPIEMPHIMILIDDPVHTVIEPLVRAPQTLLYDTDLMMDGGHITGSFIAEPDLEGAREALSRLYDQALEKYGPDDLIFQATGDGNHSLATARKYWEDLKKTLSPEEAAVHPARYALCEIENIHDPGIVFEPIHRILFGKPGETAETLLQETVRILDQQNGSARLLPENETVPEDAMTLEYVAGNRHGQILVTEPGGRLPVGVLQRSLDVLVQARQKASIDYIHGDHTVDNLASHEGNLGFLLPAMDKHLLFPAVARDGSLPRKTFSIGEANEKRYYIECRSISS